MRVLVPAVFGELMWGLFKHARHYSWWSLKRSTNTRFGLCPEEIRRAFLASKPQDGEDSAAYILWIEDTHVRLAVSTLLCWDQFVLKMPTPFLQNIDQGNQVAVLSRTGGCLDEKYLVKFAHGLVRGVKLDPNPEGRKIGGFDAALKGAPLHNVVTMIEHHATNKSVLRTEKEVYSRL